MLHASNVASFKLHVGLLGRSSRCVTNVRPRRICRVINAAPETSSSEPDFQQELAAATGRIKALEAYRHLLQSDSQPIDLFKAALLIAKHRYPLLDEAKCEGMLDGHVAKIKASLPSESSQPGYELAYITRHLAEGAGFTGNEKAYYSVDNSCFNKVLEQGTGIPISLGLLYILVAQRLGCSVHGLNLPGHFMLGNNIEGISNLLVDPFDGFKLCSLPAVEEMFEQRYGYKLMLSTAVVTSGSLVMSPQGILARMLLNLKNIYTGLHEADKVLQITRYLRATRVSPDDMRDEGLCLYAMKRYVDSAEALQQYLAAMPNAADAPEVRHVLSAIDTNLRTGFEKPDA